MNMRSIMVLSALSAFALGACLVTGTSGGSGGAGSGGSGGAGVGGSGGSGGSGSGGAGDCDPDTTCGLVFDGQADGADICNDSDSAPIYDAFFECTCTDKTANGCGTECASARCGGSGGSEADCTSCLQDTCKMETDACQSDL